MHTKQTRASRPDPAVTVSPDNDPTPQVGIGRLRGAASAVVLVCAMVGAIGEAVGTVIIGQLAAGPSAAMVAALAVCVVGGATVDSTGRVIWSSVCARAEGRLRDDLLVAVWAQPVRTLAEQSAGELLDRVDDDTHDIGSLVRDQLWNSLRVAFGVLPMWVVGGLTWWPAWVLFPIVAAGVWVSVRGMLSEIVRRKFAQEVASTDQVAHLEESIAARDDLRTSTGSAFAVRRHAELSARVMDRLDRVMAVQAQMLVIGGGLLHGLLIAVVLVGVAMVVDGRLGIASIVTLFLLTSMFVARIGQLAEELPQLQAGMGAVLRLRQLLAAEREQSDGAPVPDGDLDIRIEGLEFSYGDGSFTLRVPALEVPAGTTLALVGRSGSGKSTLAGLLSRAVEPPPGSIRLGGRDLRSIDPFRLRRAIGVVTQRTEILAGTVAQNIALFADLPRVRIRSAVDELGLTSWVAGLPEGLDTPLGPGGTVLSAGEEQLIAFARLLVRDVRVVVLDEATARMDPATEDLVIRASGRLLDGRTGVVIAHRLATTARADRVVVLRDGRIIQQGLRRDLEAREGPFRRLLSEAGADTPRSGGVSAGRSLGTIRRRVEPPTTATAAPIAAEPSLAGLSLRTALNRPSKGLVGAALFALVGVVGAQGVVTSYAWGIVVEGLRAGSGMSGLWLPFIAVVAFLVLGAIALPLAFRCYFPWWEENLLRVQSTLLAAQTAPRRVAALPPGEIVARGLDAERLVQYVDNWVDALTGAMIVVVVTALTGSGLAGGMVLAVQVIAATAAVIGRPIAGRTAAAAATARAGFGRVLVSALEASRSVKLSAATAAVRAHLRGVDAARVTAAVREYRVAAILDAIPVITVQCAVVVVWAVHLTGGWNLATALMLSATVAGFDYFGMVAGRVITEAPGVRAWCRETSLPAGGRNLVGRPAGVDLVRGYAPAPEPDVRERLESLELTEVSVIHEDGTVGVENVSMTVRPGELVLLVGRIGAGKSSLLRALTGLLDHSGVIRWNGRPIVDPATELRPGRVAWVGQSPRVLSGTWAENIVLDHPERDADAAATSAQLAPDLAAAGGLGSRVGHRGVRLSGGQVQRLALARALGTQAQVIAADDVSSALDAETELALWAELRTQGATVIGATSKRAALARADRVLVLDGGRVAATGHWRDLAAEWGHLAG